MAFYKSISEHYDDIFPQNPMQLDFVLKSFDNTSGLKVLDVGCGTGSLSIALAPHFGKVIGIDPDAKMLDLANEKAGSDQPGLSFLPYGMLDLEKHDIFNNIDVLLCFGNTLVHLGSEEEIQEFLRQAKTTLKPGGKLMIQIIHYDRIFNEKIAGLPTIENDSIKFVRNYHYTDRNALDFETILSIKESGEEIRNTISLFPILKDDLISLVQKAGFHDILVYGNFKQDPHLPGSIPLLIEASIS